MIWGKSNPTETRNYHLETNKASIPNAALNRRIPFPRVNHDLLLLPLLILHIQRTAVRRHQFHLHFMKLPVVRSGSWRVRQTVLVAQKCCDALKYPGNFAIELREPRETAGHLRKSLELILALQIVHMRTQSAA